MKVVLDTGAFMPERAHSTDAGLDLKTPRFVFLPAHGSTVIDTGVHIELPHGYFGKLESKSGLNVKHGIVSLGGVIDEGYTGSIAVKLYNLSEEDYFCPAGDKIVQLIIQPYIAPEMEVVDKLNETERNEHGFGSTGR
jgi:dUTP pyrophosphatase